MLSVLKAWSQRYLSDTQAILLVAVLLFSALAVIFLGAMLLPVIAAALIAYLLDGPVRWLERKGMARLPALLVVFALFTAGLLFLIFGLIPPIYLEGRHLADSSQEMVDDVTRRLKAFAERHPEGVKVFVDWMKTRANEFSAWAVSYSFSTVRIAMMLMIYLVLVPFLVFFFLKDKHRIGAWIAWFLPKEHELLTRLRHDVDRQFGNYVRGKFTEIIITGGITFAAFTWFGVRYSVLLSVIVGLSVVVPYVGAVVATIPVFLIGLLDFGLGPKLLWLIAVHLVIQALDGYVLVPLLFSEAVKLHPIAIVIAILVFGGLFGVWGVCFAIPLATLVNAVLVAWPRTPPPPPDLAPGSAP